jgi:hypothetical protein
MDHAPVQVMIFHMSGKHTKKHSDIQHWVCYSLKIPQNVKLSTRKDENSSVQSTYWNCCSEKAQYRVGQP